MPQDPETEGFARQERTLSIAPSLYFWEWQKRGERPSLKSKSTEKSKYKGETELLKRYFCN